MSGEQGAKEKNNRHAEKGIKRQVAPYIEGICDQDRPTSHQDFTDEQPFSDQVLRRPSYQYIAARSSIFSTGTNVILSPDHVSNGCLCTGKRTTTTGQPRDFYQVGLTYQITTLVDPVEKVLSSVRHPRCNTHTRTRKRTRTRTRTRARARARTHTRTHTRARAHTAIHAGSHEIMIIVNYFSDETSCLQYCFTPCSVKSVLMTLNNCPALPGHIC